MTRSRLFVLCLVLASSHAVEEPEARISYEGAQLLRVEAPTTHDKDEILKLADIGVLDTWSAVAQNDSQIDVFVKADAEFKVKEFLNGNNLTFEVVIENVQNAIDTESPPLSEEEMEELVGRNGHRMTWQAYHRLDDIYGYLDYMAASFPSVSVQTIGSSVEGRPLKVLSISSGKPGAPAMWIDGGVHAREWISPASVTYIINELVENRESLDGAVKGVDFHILAVANPDGYEHSRDRDRLWRKNRGNKAQGACAGVDLNRNFGYKWGGQGSSKQPCKEIYAGASAFSEPETKAMSAFVLAKAVKNELKARDSQLNASTKHQVLASNHTSVAQENEKQLLQEAVKNKEEAIVQLNLEIESLKNEKQDLDKSAKSLKSENSLLVAEVEKYKQHFGNVAKPPVPASNKTTLALRKEIDQQKLDIEKKTSEMKVLTSELENVKGELESKKTTMAAMAAENKRKVEALEIKLGEVQTTLAKEKSKTKDDKKQREADMNRIQDLTRQVKEMERILKRNHPNSISALILTANSGEASLGTSPRIKYLENRIEQLEKELETKQIEMEAGIKTIEEQYQTMKEKYDVHTADITSELATWKHDSNYWREIAEKNKTEANNWKEIADNAKVDVSVWKDTAEKKVAEIKLWKEKAEELSRPSNPVITDLGKRVLSMEDLATPQEPARSRMPVTTKSQSSSGVSSKPASTVCSLRSQPCQQQLPHRMSSNVQAVREEAHLLATIRGLNAELAGRDKTIRVLEKKLDEMNKTNKRLQKEREHLLNRDSLFKPPKVPTTSKVALKEKKLDNEVKETDSDMDSNTYSAAHYQALSNMDDKIAALKRKNRESVVQIRLLSGELSKLNDKRLQDLEDLQEEHNTEMARVLSENSSRNTSSQINQLKAKISTQDQAITVLRKYVAQSGELQDEIVILKAERDHLESCLNVANKKLSDLKDAQTPEQQHYENLREQMRELETRHECREQRLQAIIRDLISRNNAQHRPTTSDDAVQGNSEVETLRKKLLERDRQVMEYKEELDAIIEKVHEYERLTNEQCTHSHPSGETSE